MARVQDGDRDSCRTLFDDIGPMVMNFLRRRIADRSELEDVLSGQTLLALFQARHTYQPSPRWNPGCSRLPSTVAAHPTRAATGLAPASSN